MRAIAGMARSYRVWRSGLFQRSGSPLTLTLSRRERGLS